MIFRVRRPGLSRSLLLSALGCTLLLLFSGTDSPVAAAAGPVARPPAVVALTNLRLVLAPGKVISNGTLLLRDGLIEAVGERFALPPDAWIRDGGGLTAYPGLIELFDQRSIGTPVESATRVENANPVIRPGRDPLPLAGDAEANRKLREAGFTVSLIAAKEGVLRGAGLLATLADGEASTRVLRRAGTQNVALRPRDEGYPESIMGAVALTRQAFSDAVWYRDAQAAWERLPKRARQVRPTWSADLSALDRAARREQTVVFEAADPVASLRAAALARELGLDAWIVGSGREYERLEAIRRTELPQIVPLAFPKPPARAKPGEPDPEIDLLRRWVRAPGNPAALVGTGLPVAFTTFRLDEPRAIYRSIAEAAKHGLTADQALAALTTTPAKLLGMEDRLGTLAPGQLASFVLVEGDLFVEKPRIREVWIEGRKFELERPSEEKKDPSTQAAGSREPSTPPARPTAAGVDPVSAWNSALPERPEALVLRRTTLWTSGPQGTLLDSDLLVRDGKIVAVGKDLAVPAGTLELDLRGKQVTSGIIDCHSHSAIAGDVNEGTNSVTAEVRVADVLDPDDVTIYRQLAGGLTVANLLHGSANAIGGQNAVIKLRWGASPAELLFAGAPPGIKFALGENPKQSNWNVKERRFPQTRMGVEQTIRERFLAALDYRQRGEELRRPSKPERAPQRRDFQLEALVEILEGKRLVHAHSYRADEVLMLIDLADSFGFRVATFQHILEGYKVADEIARHGAGASGFSDWWAYKFEVIDGIPWNGALLHDRGVLASFNSDSGELSRRLNLEAAKAVRYGGLSEVEALRFVTLNPARQLGIADRVGSLEPGKDADFVVWSGSPLSALSVAEQTWIDGRKYFDRAADLEARARLALEQRELLARLPEPSGEIDRPDGTNAKPAPAPAAEELLR
jgi:imidazolonepropionase-like amidohydrolase